MRILISAICMLALFCTSPKLTAQTIVLSELKLTHSMNNEKGIAFIEGHKIPYVTTTFSTNTPVTFTNLYKTGEGVNEVEIREIYFQACSQCFPNFIYYYGGEGTVMRVFASTRDKYEEVLDLQQIGRILVAAK